MGTADTVQVTGAADAKDEKTKLTKNTASNFFIYPPLSNLYGVAKPSPSRKSLNSIRGFLMVIAVDK